MKNGLSVNYPDPAMRRRDPDCMVVADDQPSDKERFDYRFGESFDGLRKETFEWFKKQDLIILPLYTGGKELGFPTLLVAPKNAAFFVGALADLQEMLPAAQVGEDFNPRRSFTSLRRFDTRTSRADKWLCTTAWRACTKSLRTTSTPVRARKRGFTASDSSR